MNDNSFKIYSFNQLNRVKLKIDDDEMLPRQYEIIPYIQGPPPPIYPTTPQCTDGKEPDEKKNIS